MITYIYVTAVLFTASHVFAANPKEQSKAASACDVFFNPKNIEKMCCTSVDQYLGDTEDCGSVSSQEYTCDKAICSLSKIDVLDANNEIDEKKYEEYLDNIVSENPKEKSAVDNIKERCLGGKFHKYLFPDDNCTPMKLLMCTFLHSTMECTTWKTDDGCGELATSAAECKPYLTEMLDKMLQ